MGGEMVLWSQGSLNQGELRAVPAPPFGLQRQPLSWVWNQEVDGRQSHVPVRDSDAGTRAQ